MERMQYHDKPSPRPYHLELTTGTTIFTPDNIHIFRFRKRPDLDHIMHMEGERSSRILFGLTELIMYLCDEVRDADRYTFSDQFEWSPKVTTEDYPPDSDVDFWLKVESSTVDEEWQSGI